MGRPGAGFLTSIKWTILATGETQASKGDKNVLAIDIYTFGEKFPSILDFSTGKFWSLSLTSKKADDVKTVLEHCADKEGINLEDRILLTDRGVEFQNLSEIFAKHFRTAAHHPEADGKIEKIHRELSVFCRIYC